MRMWLLALLPIVAEALVQAVPGAGIVLSKLLTPVASAWCLLMVDARMRQGSFAPGRSAVRMVRGWWRVAALVVLAVTVFLVQMGVVAALAGAGQAHALLAGDLASLQMGRWALAAMLASGALPAMLLFFVGPRILLDGVMPAIALGENLRLLARGWRPLLVLGCAKAAATAALVFAPWLLLLMLPVFGYVGYAAYRDVFDHGMD